MLNRREVPYFVTFDGNEQYESVESLAELIGRIRKRPELARLWQSTLFIEQPIARMLALETDIWGAALGKPVIIDESDG